MQASEGILLVDPNATRRAALHGLLLRQGLVVRSVGTVAAAVAAFEAQPCATLIAAFHLRRGSGLDLARQLRARDPDLAVILVGARSLTTALAALRGGADDYVPRPTSAEELARALEHAAQARAARLERRARELALRAQIAHLEATQANVVQATSLAALGRLASNLAHEINNPLTPILGMADLLLEDLPADHPGRAYAEAIATSAQRIRKVVRSLIDFARPSAHQFSELDLGELIHDILLLTEQQLHDQGIVTVMSLPTEPIIITGSLAQLKQALLFLIDNAREAMPGGGQLSIALSVEQMAPEQAGPGVPAERRAVITVRDTGKGIAPEHLPYIFEPFFSTKPQASGVGLGLAIVSGIVREHKGMAQVDSVEGRGSTFRIILPLAERSS